MVASLIATARLNGLDPKAYFRHMLKGLAEHPVRRVAEFLPWNLQAGAPFDTI